MEPARVELIVIVKRRRVGFYAVTAAAMAINHDHDDCVQ